MNNIAAIAKDYFSAFHMGKLDAVFAFLDENAIVQYGTEEAKSAKLFFPEAKELISQLTFKTLGIYTSNQTRNVIIHFSFSMPGDSEASTTEAIDIIEFNEQDKIIKITVIPNG